MALYYNDLLQVPGIHVHLILIGYLEGIIKTVLESYLAAIGLSVVALCLDGFLEHKRRDDVLKLIFTFLILIIELELGRLSQDYNHLYPSSLYFLED